jgi:hypothetical protein
MGGDGEMPSACQFLYGLARGNEAGDTGGLAFSNVYKETSSRLRRR